METPKKNFIEIIFIRSQVFQIHFEFGELWRGAVVRKEATLQIHF